MYCTYHGKTRKSAQYLWNFWLKWVWRKIETMKNTNDRELMSFDISTMNYEYLCCGVFFFLVFCLFYGVEQACFFPRSWFFFVFLSFGQRYILKQGLNNAWFPANVSYLRSLNLNSGLAVTVFLSSRKLMVCWFRVPVPAISVLAFFAWATTS